MSNFSCWHSVLFFCHGSLWASLSSSVAHQDVLPKGARRDNHLIGRGQAVGKSVLELSAAFSQALEMGARLEDVAGTIHAHPTLGETIQEAAMRAWGHALHI